MKNIITLFFLFLSVSTYSQIRFGSESDVYQYLVSKSPFKNNDANVSLTFSDMGGRLSTGRSNYYNSDIFLISSTRAKVKYQSLNDPDLSVEMIVDSKENVIMDTRDRSIFKATTYQIEQPTQKTIRQPVKAYTNKKVIQKTKKKY